uniref:Ig-like domain-containing protein n=1 Tax=Oreochromis aureus TaxID=47969 RepID=A0AAZ1XGS0_OREAU
MAGIKCVVFLVVLTFQWTFVKADTEVSCIFMERCMLPCSYGGSDVVIHWQQVSARDITVHSFYHNQDQLERQNQQFRGRTSLFNDLISTGNASLQLTKVEVQDEGRYKCYTSTDGGNQESFINLKIDAPVSKVNIQRVGNIITCSSEGIYPKPELTWSTSPSTKNITVQLTEQLLYNISSSLIVSDSETDVDHSCTISTPRNRKRATLFKPVILVWSNTDKQTTILCPPSDTSFSYLIWRFNHSRIIVTRSGADISYTVYAGWEQHVKHVSESGSLTLQDLTANHVGIYTCELSDAEEMKVSENKMMMMTDPAKDSNLKHSTRVGVIIVAVLCCAALVGLILYCIKKR